MKLYVTGSHHSHATGSGSLEGFRLEISATSILKNLMLVTEDIVVKDKIAHNTQSDLISTLSTIKGPLATRSIMWMLYCIHTLIISFNPFLYIYLFYHLEEKGFWKILWEKVKLLKMSNFTFSHNVFYAICISKSFYSHHSVVVCTFFEFGMVSK